MDKKPKNINNEPSGTAGSEDAAQAALTPAQRVKSDWKTLMQKVSYKTILNNIPYLSFLVLLCVAYISNSHRAIELQREMNEQDKTRKELRWKYMDTKSKLMSEMAETRIILRADSLGLRPSAMPAYKIQGTARAKSQPANQ